MAPRSPSGAARARARGPRRCPPAAAPAAAAQMRPPVRAGPSRRRVGNGSAGERPAVVAAILQPPFGLLAVVARPVEPLLPDVAEPRGARPRRLRRASRPRGRRSPAPGPRRRASAGPACDKLRRALLHPLGLVLLVVVGGCWGWAPSCARAGPGLACVARAPWPACALPLVAQGPAWAGPPPRGCRRLKQALPRAAAPGTRSRTGA
eukprot:9492698-Pyramimonas_sp.AAC.1